MKIKTENGYVVYRMRTGTVYVRSKMPLSNANAIVKAAKETGNRVIDGEKVLAVDDTYFFPIEPEIVSKSVARRMEEQKK